MIPLYLKHRQNLYKNSMFQHTVIMVTVISMTDLICHSGSCSTMCHLIVVVQSLIVLSLNLTPITLRWEPDVKQCLTRVSVQIYAGTDPSYCLPSICPICRICSWHSRWITSHIKWNLAWCGTLWLTLLDAGVWSLNLGQGGPNYLRHF